MTAPESEEVARHARDWRVRILLPIGMVFLRLLASTWRVKERNAAPWRELSRNRKGWILSLWHGTLVPVAYQHRNLGTAVLVSEHRDGELIARVLQWWGWRPIRGSSTRGGTRALREMIRELSRGSAVCVTPDGPKGPPKVYQQGGLVAAQRADVPIVAIGVHVDRAWRLKSWDTLIIPKPFARLTFAYESPEMVQGASSRDAVLEGPRFEQVMSAAQRRAEAPS